MIVVKTISNVNRRDPPQRKLNGNYGFQAIFVFCFSTGHCARELNENDTVQRARRGGLIWQSNSQFLYMRRWKRRPKHMWWMWHEDSLFGMCSWNKVTKIRYGYDAKLQIKILLGTHLEIWIYSKDCLCKEKRFSAVKKVVVPTKVAFMRNSNRSIFICGNLWPLIVVCFW